MSLSDAVLAASYDHAAATNGSDQRWATCSQRIKQRVTLMRDILNSYLAWQDNDATDLDATALAVAAFNASVALNLLHAEPWGFNSDEGLLTSSERSFIAVAEQLLAQAQGAPA